MRGMDGGLEEMEIENGLGAEAGAICTATGNVAPLCCLIMSIMLPYHERLEGRAICQ